MFTFSLLQWLNQAWWKVWEHLLSRGLHPPPFTPSPPPPLPLSRVCSPKSRAGGSRTGSLQVPLHHHLYAGKRRGGGAGSKGEDTEKAYLLLILGLCSSTGFEQYVTEIQGRIIESPPFIFFFLTAFVLPGSWTKVGYCTFSEGSFKRRSQQREQISRTRSDDV